MSERNFCERCDKQISAVEWDIHTCTPPAPKRPQNCGTGHCSCIECVMEPAQQELLAWTDEQLQMLNFLYGAGDFDGVWFDQKHPTEKGVFWWRKHLRRLFASPPTQRKPLTDAEILTCGPGQPDAVWSYEDQLYFARSIQAAHGIKA